MSIGKHEAPNKGKTDIWLTPRKIVNSLGQFDLDPCAHSGHQTAETMYYESGLQKPWFGKVWLNPPYSNVGEWLEKLADHADSGGCGIALVFARTETKWFQKTAQRATGMFFPSGRIKFLTEQFETKGNAGAPSVFLNFRCEITWENVMPGIEVSRFRSVL